MEVKENNFIEDLAQEVKDVGIAKKENWLEKKDQEKINNIIDELNCSKGDIRGIFSAELKSRVIEILKFKFKKTQQFFYFKNLSKTLGLNKIADKIFNAPSRLLRVDCYISSPSNEPVLQWHLDNAYSGRTDVKKFVHPQKNSIKFFFYLTDVGTENGCLGYIPYSHKIAFFLKEGIYLKLLNYTPYWKLGDFRKAILIEENYKYILSKINSNILEKFLANAKTKITEKDSIFDHPVKAGGAVIFDEAGCHRGSKVSKTPRKVLRFFYLRNTQ